MRSSGEFLLLLGKYRKRMHAAIVAFWVVVFLLPYLATAWLPRGFNAVAALRPCLIIDGTYIDLLERTGRTTPPNPDIVFLGIDDASGRLDALDPAEVQASRPLTLMTQPFPWSHEVYAAALDRLTDAGARVVIFDLLFTNPQPSDPIFRASLDRHADQVVLGCNFSDLGDDLTLPSTSLIPARLPLDPRTAFVNFDPGVDGVIRYARFHRPYNGAALGQVDSTVQVDSMAARAAAIAEPTLALPLDDEHRFIRYTGGPGSFDSASIYQLFDPDSWSHTFRNGDYFRGKIVMIGPKGNFRQDEHLTGHRAERSPEAVDAGRIDDVRLVGAAQHRQERAAAVVDPAPADVEGLFPLGAGRIDEAAAAADAGVVEQQVDLVGLLVGGDLTLEAVDVLFDRDVGEVGGDLGALGRLLAAEPGGLGHVGLGEVAHGDAAALGHQLPGELAPHAGPTARDDRDLAGEVLHLTLSLDFIAFIRRPQVASAAHIAPMMPKARRSPWVPSPILFIT